MKIYAASKEDILRRQEENEAWYNEQNEKYQKQYTAYKEEWNNVAEQVESYIKDQLKIYIEPLRLDIRVSSPSSFYSPSYKIRIEADHGYANSEDTALSWTYQVELDKDGNLQSESNSWSGLKATTPELIKNLQLSVDCLKWINGIDWKGLLEYYTKPDYDEWVTEEDPDRKYQDTKYALNKEMQQAELDSLIGTNKVVLYKGESKYWYSDTYVKIYRDTGKQYEIGEVSANYVNNGQMTKEELLKELDYKHRISKEKFISGLAKPLEIVDLDTLN